ncbi:unnamed protein product [Durusdinium trenchii]|uniref:Protein kinase domain-containing protein n=1 Tax=Durusdinium trenchii TaxID=1381693 RepID=A0ABP0LZF0_9DINO
MLARRGAAAVPLVQASRSLLQQLRFKGQQPQVPQVHRSLAGTADLLTINVRHLLSSLKLRILDLVYPETWSARDFREGTVTAFKSVNSLLDEGDFLLLRQLLDEKLLEDLRSSHAHLTEGLKYELVEVYYLGIFHAMAKEDDQGFEAVFVTPLLRVTEKYTSLKDESVWWEVRRLHKWTFKRILLGEDAADWQIALDECICLVLDADEFFQIVGHFRDELERRMQLQDLNLSISDLQCKAVVGRGTFGVVRLVTPKGKKDAPEYALKCVKKAQVVKGRQERAIVMEREVNMQCYHPCIVQFIKTFQDKYNVYFLTEFLGGGDLFYAIRLIGALTKLQCQFFSGSIALGIEYLHGRGIMYRDLKPENVLLDFAGRAKLVDFGCCKKEIRASTLVGTPEYLAPEVIKGKGYTKCIDWWSLGVMLYEFIVGPIPFGAGEEDQMKLFAAICEAPLAFPAYVPEDAMQVLAGLLERRPERRLGSFGAKEIKKHQWFKLFDWDALAGGFFPPPWQPDAKVQMSNWEEPDGELMDHVSTESFTFGKGMEWAKGF